MNKVKIIAMLALVFAVFPQDSKAWGSIKDSIYAAAKSGDIRTIENYLYQGYSIDATDSDGMTALCSASWDYQPYAYNLLISYGANPNASCMYYTPRSSTSSAKSISSGTYLVAGGVALAVGGGIAALASGGGGGGSGSGSATNDNSGSGTGTGTGGSGSGSGTGTGTGTGGSGSGSGTGTGTGGSGSGSGTGTGTGTGGSSISITLYQESFFRYDNEFKSGKFGTYNYGGVQFLPSINASPAYARYYGTDALGNEGNILTGTSTVGIIDTGVDGSHSEFSDGKGGSKVSGYNFDYGPCNGTDRKNCWLFEYNSSKKYYTLTFYNASSQNSGLTYIVGYNDYLAWYQTYPAGYNWDVYKERSDSYYPITSISKNPLTDGYYAHGTNIAGIIAANRDGSNVMGVAFTNTNIKAVRWDLLSSIYEPVKALVDDKVLAINLSVGSTASYLKSSRDYLSSSVSMLEGYKSAAAYTIGQYTNYTFGGKTYKDGTIWVKAAGNNGYDYPDLESGIKLIGTYSNLMMMVVVNVEVSLNSDGTVNTYSLDSSSNKCGNTSGYCIAAPGSLIYSTNAGGGYIGMGGTSQAAPVVVGSIAFLKNAFPSLRSEQIINLLMNTANKGASDYSESKYGAGLLDLGAAMEYQSPVGTSSVVTVSGDDLSSPYVRLDNASLVLSSTMSEALQKALPESITAFDAYDRPYNYPTSMYIRSSHSGYKNLKEDVSHIIPTRKRYEETKGNIHYAYASGGTYNKPLNYMMSEYKSGRHSNGFYFSENSKYQNKSGRHADMNNPYMSFTSAYGYMYGYEVNPKLQFNMEITGGRNGLYDGDNDYNDGSFKKPAYGFDSGIEYQYSQNIKLGISSGMLYENDALLGSNGENAFGLSGGQTYHMGLNAAWNLNPRWTISGSYYQGYTKAQNMNSGLIKTSDLVSSGYSASLNYAYDKSLNMGLRVSSPLRIEKGSVSVDFANGRDVDSDRVYRNRYRAPLKPQHREYKFAIYADKDVSENLSLSSEIDMRIHPEHSSDDTDYRALFGLSWNF